MFDKDVLDSIANSLSKNTEGDERTDMLKMLRDDQVGAARCIEPHLSSWFAQACLDTRLMIFESGDKRSEAVEVANHLKLFFAEEIAKLPT